jgi:hypothetical protein
MLGLWWVIDTFVMGNLAPPEPAISVTTSTTVLEAIKQVNKQIFIEHYNAVDVSYSEAPNEWLGRLGVQQEFIVLVRGRVPAGLDLSQVTEDSIWISEDGSRIQLTLPPPIIFEDNVSLDLENSRIFTNRDTCPSFLCDDSLSAYQSVALPEAERMLIEMSQENGILNQAARDGQLYYEQLLRSLGFDEVRVIVPGY